MARVTRDAVPLRVAVVAPQFQDSYRMWGDQSGDWQPSPFAWLGRLAALGVPYDVVGHPNGDYGLVIAADGESDAPDVLTGPPPSTAEETLLLLAGHLGAVVTPDLRGVLVLRLDDPGAAVKEHLRGWTHRPVQTSAWEALWSALEGFGRASVFCCPGFVRADGTVVDSRVALPAEWAALDVGVARRLIELECHGYTHMHPDTDAWAAADDRHDDERWFRELWPPLLGREPSVRAQAERLRSWQRAVGARGTALVAPGEEWGLNTLAAARNCGFRLFNSWGVCFLDRAVPTWTTGVGSPYLDQADPSWFADGLPQIGYWHDRDMALHGPRWVGKQLEGWRDCGATRAWSFADLARAYGPIDAALIDGEVVVRSAPDVPLRLVRP
jgi:hypothetical protein